MFFFILYFFSFSRFRNGSLFSFITWWCTEDNLVTGFIKCGLIFNLYLTVTHLCFLHSYTLQFYVLSLYSFHIYSFGKDSELITISNGKANWHAVGNIWTKKNGSLPFLNIVFLYHFFSFCICIFFFSFILAPFDYFLCMVNWSICFFSSFFYIFFGSQSRRKRKCNKMIEYELPF